jgi:hypothetical protein
VTTKFVFGKTGTTVLDRMALAADQGSGPEDTVWGVEAVST